MTTDSNTKPETITTTFTCKNCGQVKPFEDMVIVSNYFPPMVICDECAKKAHWIRK